MLLRISVNWRPKNKKQDPPSCVLRPQLCFVHLRVNRAHLVHSVGRHGGQSFAVGWCQSPSEWQILNPDGISVVTLLVLPCELLSSPCCLLLPWQCPVWVCPPGFPEQPLVVMPTQVDHCREGRQLSPAATNYQHRRISTSTLNAFLLT